MKTGRFVFKTDTEEYRSLNGEVVEVIRAVDEKLYRVKFVSIPDSEFSVFSDELIPIGE